MPGYVNFKSYHKKRFDKDFELDNIEIVILKLALYGEIHREREKESMTEIITILTIQLKRS